MKVIFNPDESVVKLIKEGLEKVNKMFGLNLTVKFRFEGVNNVSVDNGNVWIR